MSERFLSHVRNTLAQIRADGFHKAERVIASPQSPAIERDREEGRELIAAGFLLEVREDHLDVSCVLPE